jgi:nitrate reductase delta subunit
VTSPYTLLSVLLRYPDERVEAARGEIREAVAQLRACPQRDGLRAFCAAWDGLSAADYVATFDLDRRTSLYLTFYRHGDTRARGMALLRLKKLYRAAGFPWDSRELPDFLPGMLELAAASPAHGEALLAEHRAELELLRLALHDSETPYGHLLDAVVAGLPRPDERALAEVRRLLAEGPPVEMVGLR